LTGKKIQREKVRAQKAVRYQADGGGQEDAEDQRAQNCVDEPGPDSEREPRQGHATGTQVEGGNAELMPLEREATEKTATLAIQMVIPVSQATNGSLLGHAGLAPRSEHRVPGRSETGITIWIASVAVFSVASLSNGINFSRYHPRPACPWHDPVAAPLTVWAWFINAILSTLIFSILLAASVCLISDRL